MTYIPISHSCGRARLSGACPRIRSRPRVCGDSGVRPHLRTGELRKDGTRVKLHGQPWEVLIALLENAGGIVTRQQLRDRSGAPTHSSTSITASTSRLTKSGMPSETTGRTHGSSRPFRAGVPVHRAGRAARCWTARAVRGVEPAKGGLGSPVCLPAALPC